MNSALTLSGWGRRVGKSLMKLQDKTPQVDILRWNIVRGDNVHVIQGPAKGQSGKIIKVLRKSNRVIVEGVNMRRRNEKSRIPGIPGKIVVKPCTVHYSNVMLIDPTNGEPTKVSRRYLESGEKVRISKLTGNVIPKPDPLVDKKPRSIVLGDKDTTPEDVETVTFDGYEKYAAYVYANFDAKMEAKKAAASEASSK